MEESDKTVKLVKALSQDLQEKARTMSGSEALDIVHTKSAELGGQAKEHMTVLGGALQDFGVGLRSSAERGMDEEIKEDIQQKAELVRRKTQESLDVVGEKAQAF